MTEPTKDHANPGMPDFDHRVHFYEDRDVISRSIVDFFTDGYRGGERLVLLATESRMDEVRKGLRQSGVDFDEACEAGHARYSEARHLLDQLLVEGAPDPERFTAKVAPFLDFGDSSRVRVFAELVDLLASEGKHDDAVVLEDLWNQLARSRKFSLYCAYHVGNLYREVNADAYRSICERHDDVVDDLEARKVPAGGTETEPRP